jgi:Uri superfamily endonuclease
MAQAPPMARQITLPPPGVTGAYQLVLRLAGAQRITIGAMGERLLPGGYYVYVGSAMGSGGLAARLGHHLARSRRPHWHIDHFLLHPRCTVVAAIARPSEEREECRICQATAALPGASFPLPRFGNGDARTTGCPCPSHLLHFPRRPALR